jgi:hypothetical protein
MEMGFRKLFCPGWPGAMILPIPASEIARLIGVSHWGLAGLTYFKGDNLGL